jgi:hypothetical protein
MVAEGTAPTTTGSIAAAMAAAAAGEGGLRRQVLDLSPDPEVPAPFQIKLTVNCALIIFFHAFIFKHFSYANHMSITIIKNYNFSHAHGSLEVWRFKEKGK